MENEIPFPEWMAANALYRFVSYGPNVNQCIDWLFDGYVKVPGPDRKILKELCGFDRNASGFGKACETGLKLENAVRLSLRLQENIP